MCVEEDLGDHIPLAWNNSPVKLHRNHMLRSLLVIWLQPCGSPQRESRKIDLQKGNVAWMQGEKSQRPCRHTEARHWKTDRSIKFSSLRGRGGKAQNAGKI